MLFLQVAKCLFFPQFNIHEYKKQLISMLPTSPTFNWVTRKLWIMNSSWRSGGFLLNLVLNSSTLLSHPLADFFSVKGNQDYIKIAHSNWHICSPGVTCSVSKFDFLEALANYHGKTCLNLLTQLVYHFGSREYYPQASEYFLLSLVQVQTFPPRNTHKYTYSLSSWVTTAQLWSSLSPVTTSRHTFFKIRSTVKIMQKACIS